MTNRQRIRADRLLATPVAFLGNGLARVLGAILRRDHSIEPEGVREIVVAKLVGMGSAIQTMPLLRALRSRFPDARLTFVTLRANRELVARLAPLDDVLCLDDRGVFRMALTTVSTIGRLIRRKVDLYFDLELYSAFASLVALLAVTRNRIGFYRHSTRFKKGIYTHLVYFNTRMSVSRLYLQLGRIVGADVSHDSAIGPLRVLESDRLSLHAKVAGLRDASGRSYVVVNPNASDLLLERRWPAGHVIRAIEQLVQLGERVVLIGSPKERPYVEDLVDQLRADLRPGVVNTAGQLDLGELLALLGGAGCVLTNDTGPMHMAVALGRPAVCLFGPVHPDHHGHQGQDVINLYAPVFCSPCLHEIDDPPCHGNNVCMQRLQPDLVTRSVRRLLERQPGLGAIAGGAEPERLPLLTEGPDGLPLGFVVRDSVPRTKRD